MLIFYKHNTYNYFALDNTTGKIEFISAAGYRTFSKYRHFIGGLDRLDIKDDEALKQFRKIAKKGVFKDVPLSETKQYLLDNYPELFI